MTKELNIEMDTNAILGVLGNRPAVATPMTRLEYNNSRGWDLPADENSEDKGMRITYFNPMHSNWLPQEVFEAMFEENGTLSFGTALNQCIDGQIPICRAGWNGKGMSVKVSTISLEDSDDYSFLLILTTPDGKVVPWHPSTADLFAKDWSVIV